MLLTVTQGASIDIGTGVKRINGYAFNDCTALKSVTIPDNVTYLGSSVFANGTGLTTVNFNAENCTKMGNGYAAPFDGCTVLRTVNFAGNVKIIQHICFTNTSGLLP